MLIGFNVIVFFLSEIVHNKRYENGTFRLIVAVNDIYQ